MAVRLNNSAEGQVNGTAISTGANTGGGSGDIFAASKTATASITFSSTQKSHGTNSYQFVFTSASESGYLQWAPVGEAQPTYGNRGGIWFSAAPGVDQFIAGSRNSGGNVLTVVVSTARRFKILNATGGTIFTGTVDVPTSTWCRFEWLVTKGTTTGDGQVKFKWFVGDSTTPAETEFVTTTANVGTTDIAATRWGRASAVGSAAWTYYLDDLATQTAATDYIGPFGANAAPIVSTPGDIIVAATGAPQSIPLECTASDDGSIASYAWACTLNRSSARPADPVPASPSSQNTTVSLQYPGRYEFTVTVTDNLGLPSTATQVIYVTTPTPKVSGLLSNAGAFTNVGGGTDIATAVSDASDTTISRSPAAPSSEAIIDYYLDPMPVNDGFNLTLRHKLSSAGTGVAKVRLKEGATVRKEWTPTIPGTSATNQVLTLSSGEAAAVTSWLNLILELTWT
jgi:hypothetical protein